MNIEKLLADLHTKTVEELLKRIASGEATAADLGVARALLKDNNITATPAEGSPLEALTASLPFTGEDGYDGYTQ